MTGRRFHHVAAITARIALPASWIFYLVLINALLGSNTLIEIWLPSAHIELLEEAFDVGDVVGAAVGWQGFEEDFAVAGGADAGVEEHEDSAV